MLKQQFLTALTDQFAIFTGVGQAQYDNPGDIRVEAGGSGQAVYKFVKFTGTTVTAIGDVLGYTDTTLQTVDGALSTIAAGVAMSAIAGGATGVLWVQIMGKATLNTNMGGPPAAGNGLTYKTTAKTLTVQGAATDAQFGVAINTTNLALLQCGL